eukprot:5296943-Pyramimonas_sp.AAC.1
MMSEMLRSALSGYEGSNLRQEPLTRASWNTCAARRTLRDCGYSMTPCSIGKQDGCAQETGP